MANCTGSTSARLRLRMDASCSASASSRCRTTSSDACRSTASRSTGPPAASAIWVMRSATSGDLATMCAGRHRSWRSVIHRKSSTSRSALPVSGLRRVPRPTICTYRLRTLVARSTTTQSTLGQSQPSVSSIELHSTEPGPAASKRASVSARSGLSPLTSMASKPRFASAAANFLDVATSGRNATVLRPMHPAAAISSAMRPRYGSSAVPRSPAAKSPEETLTPARSMATGTVSAWMGHRYPSRMAVGSVYS